MYKLKWQGKKCQGGPWLTSIHLSSFVCLYALRKNKKLSYFIQFIFTVLLKVSKSRKRNTLSLILLKDERWRIFLYWKMPQRSFYGRIQDAIICFRDLLTFITKDHSFSIQCLNDLQFMKTRYSSQCQSWHQLSV